MKFLEHRIPPPAVGLGIGALMLFLAALLGVPLFVLYINRFR